MLSLETLLCLYLLQLHTTNQGKTLKNEKQEEEVTFTDDHYEENMLGITSKKG